MNNIDGIGYAIADMKKDKYSQPIATYFQRYYDVPYTNLNDLSGWTAFIIESAPYCIDRVIYRHAGIKIEKYHLVDSKNNKFSLKNVFFMKDLSSSDIMSVKNTVNKVISEMALDDHENKVKDVSELDSLKKVLIDNNLEMIIRNPKEKNMSWKFKVAAESAIDWDSIKADLNYKNPIALVVYNDHTYVIVSEKLMDKAYYVAKNTPRYISSTVDNVFVVEGKSAFNEWVEWAKDVKASAYPAHVQEKGVVTVTLPKV